MERDGMLGAGLPPGQDVYYLSTVEHDDVVTLADGDFVVRQQTIRARTVMGKHYENTCCFVFRFDADVASRT